ncbi:HK97 gp10 family phage protein [uncultured Sphingomonas sp.]|uniref:HK97 gp10 family phage protein n=1 Tax=uncultured Sphingomonas sp. TaxID=158754 RepID=UPI0025F32545|nr:HK97 gp10 family phage protein [uncultured Sphingomonas sp.]
MAGVRGREAVSRYLRDLPEELTKVLRGAGRAGGKVIADEARAEVRSDLVRANITAKSAIDAEQVRVTVTVKRGFARSVGTWLEYGTDPHFISVDDSVRRGMSVGRINRAGSDEHKASLVINGKPVGTTVFHEGARPYPFLRPALDRKGDDAIGAAKQYVLSRIKGGAVVAEPEAQEGDE